jgi:hypothetical protein
MTGHRHQLNRAERTPPQQRYWRALLVTWLIALVIDVLALVLFTPFA